jgi:5'-3' exonuclease
VKIHIVDGTYELFRAHFGQPPRIAPDGMQVSAVRGLIQTLLSLTRQGDVTHLAVAFDSEIKSFRNDLYENYKDGSDTPEDLRLQFPLAERAVHSLGICIWPAYDFEADDVLGSAAILYSSESEVDQVVICTPDKDLAQVVCGKQIVCLDRKNNLIMDESEVISKFGVSPNSIPDYLALVGDSADGIPGIPKWGKKSSSIILSRYKNIENIPSSSLLWDVSIRGSDGLSQSLETSRSDAMLYKELATLKLDVFLEEKVEDLGWKGAHEDLFKPLCVELGMESLSRSVALWS